MKKNPEVKIVIVTGYIKETIGAYYGLDISAILEKPIDFHLLETSKIMIIFF